MQLVDLKAIADDERVHWALFLLLGWMVVYPEAKFYIVSGRPGQKHNYDSSNMAK